MKKNISFVLLVLFSFVLLQCKFRNLTTVNNAASDLKEEHVRFTAAPVYSPAQSLSKMKVEEGFEVKLVAQEPLLSTPIAISFEANGRIWVVEMEGYMPDTLGTGEDAPNGKIVILTDKNNDGVADDRKVFLDSLVLPRGICLVDKGILVVEPPMLWYYEIKNDKPIKKILVDATYGEGGNAESQANGLYRAMDNWIYSAASDRKYRCIKGKWVMARTHKRGQWGLSQDDFGRLYYNNNTQNLLGDYFTPGLGAINKNQRNVVGYSEKIVFDNNVYPIRPTPGINRGYKEGILDEQLRLVNFTAACGPLVYRGDLFGEAYANNAFVAEPAANLIKRNILTAAGNQTSGVQAYSGKEFLSSFDERFRPVSLYDGPDGALYVVDMYRGIIQHKAFLTTYLKKEIRIRNLTEPLSFGRIYKIVPKDKKANLVSFPHNPRQLAKLLGHPNGWVRDKAQQLLIDRKEISVVPTLRQFLKETDKPLRITHALWTLEGLGALKAEDVFAMLKLNVWSLRMQALSILPAVLNQGNYIQFNAVLEQMIHEKDALAAPYLAYLIHSLQPLNPAIANNLSRKIIGAYPDDQFVVDAVISNLEGNEIAFYKELQTYGLPPDLLIHKRLGMVVNDIKNSQLNSNALVLEKQFPRGAKLFKTTCQPCHGADGNGIKMLAPPLNQSEWVKGDKNHLIPIVLYGLTGPVQVNGVLYKVPEVSGDMPGIGHDPDMVDEDVAQILNFIRKSWSNNADKIKVDDISAARYKFRGRQKAFTVEELQGI